MKENVYEITMEVNEQISRFIQKYFKKIQKDSKK
jgi:hypothetical protein